MSYYDLRELIANRLKAGVMYGCDFNFGAMDDYDGACAMAMAIIEDIESAGCRLTYSKNEKQSVGPVD